MRFLGEIVGTGAGEISRSKWLAFIRSDGRLSPVPSQMGINPFTRQPAEFRAPATSARVLIEDDKLGAIEWALDDSPLLNVWAEEESADAVTGVAEDVAAALDGRFVPSKG